MHAVALNEYRLHDCKQCRNCGISKWVVETRAAAAAAAAGACEQQVRTVVSRVDVLSNFVDEIATWTRLALMIPEVVMWILVRCLPSSTSSRSEEDQCNSSRHTPLAQQRERSKNAASQAYDDRQLRLQNLFLSLGHPRVKRRVHLTRHARASVRTSSERVYAVAGEQARDSAPSRPRTRGRHVGAAGRAAAPAAA
eukprot:COSAG02_NODE_3851_length_6147_cov_3.345899_1_plen_196_part_00